MTRKGMAVSKVMDTWFDTEWTPACGYGWDFVRETFNSYTVDDCNNLPKPEWIPECIESVEDGWYKTTQNVYVNATTRMQGFCE